MKNTDAHEVIVISIRLSKKNLQSDFYPFILEPEARHLFLKELCQRISARDDLLDIQQHLDEILLTLDGQLEDSYLFALTLPQLISAIIDTCNDYGKTHQWFYSLSACMAIDAGLSAPIRLAISKTISPITQWTGLHADRVSALTKEMTTGNYPSRLLTHAFYKKLPSSTQSQYTKLYYIHHICCYCCAL